MAPDFWNLCDNCAALSGRDTRGPRARKHRVCDTCQTASSCVAYPRINKQELPAVLPAPHVVDKCDDCGLPLDYGLGPDPVPQSLNGKNLHLGLKGSSTPRDGCFIALTDLSQRLAAALLEERINHDALLKNVSKQALLIAGLSSQVAQLTDDLRKEFRLEIQTAVAGLIGHSPS